MPLSSYCAIVTMNTAIVVIIIVVIIIVFIIAPCVCFHATLFLATTFAACQVLYPAIHPSLYYNYPPCTIIYLDQEFVI